MWLVIYILLIDGARFVREIYFTSSSEAGKDKKIPKLCLLLSYSKFVSRWIRCSVKIFKDIAKEIPENHKTTILTVKTHLVGHL